LFFRHDVPETLRTRLVGFSDEELNDAERMRLLLGDIAPVTKTIQLCWYTVDRLPDASEFRDVTRRDGRFVVLVNGRVASQAWGECADERAEEVSVATVPEFRGRGYARQVVAAWMHAVMTQGKTRALARSVGVTWLADEIEYINES
jgi:GNAT superfamily N-acetyltransferase